MMKAKRSSETSIFTRSTRRHIPEDGILYIVLVLCLSCSWTLKLYAVRSSETSIAYIPEDSTSNKYTPLMSTCHSHCTACSGSDTWKFRSVVKNVVPQQPASTDWFWGSHSSAYAEKYPAAYSAFTYLLWPLLGPL
jgi:hypothetical protein